MTIPADAPPPVPRPRPGLSVIALVGVLVALGAIVGLVLSLVDGDHPRLEGAFAGVALVSMGVVAVVLAKQAQPAADTVEARHAARGPEHELTAGTRRWLIAGGIVAATAALLAPVLTYRSRPDRALRRTAWAPGARLVDSSGAPLTLDDLPEGAIATAWPAGHLGDADAQVVVMNVGAGRVRLRREDRPEPEGILAYSKLCTHMACPLGLFQSDPALLICPCHQATFAVLEHGRPVHGPARRNLPRLPLYVEDGVLHAQRDFDEPVGAGWWSRPR